MSLKAFRGAFLDFIDDPFYVSEADSVRYFADGLLILEDGKVKALGTYESLHEVYANISVTAYPDRLIMPGFIDTHVHFSPNGDDCGVWGAIAGVVEQVYLSH